MNTPDDSDRTQPPKQKAHEQPSATGDAGATAAGNESGGEEQAPTLKDTTSVPPPSAESGSEANVEDASTDRTTAMKTRRQPVLGGFPIEEKIGEGGMGMVYRAFDPDLHRTVAIKKIHPRLIGDEEFALRFTQEARAIAAVSHTNIAQIHSIHARNQNDPPFFVMEYVAGPSIDAIVKEHGAVDPARAVEITLQAARGLRAAHIQGLVHSDVKPSNILTTERGSVKLVDFGLSCRLGDSISNYDGDEIGVAFGTPHYSSPEQTRGLPLDHRADIYSLGCTLYFMLVGEELFKGKTTADLIAAHCSQSPPRLADKRPDLAQGFDGLLSRMLAKRPENRYQSYDLLINDLTALLQRLRPRPMRHLPTLVAAIVVAATAVAVWFASSQWQRSQESEPLDLANHFGVAYLEHDGLRGEGLELDFSKPEVFPEERRGRFWTSPLAGLDRDHCVPPWIHTGQNQLQWRNYSSPVTFPAYEEFEFVELAGLEIHGSPDFEIAIGSDPDRPGNDLRIAFRVGQRNEKIVELLVNGEWVRPKGLAENTAFTIKQGRKHTIRLTRKEAGPGTSHHTYELVVQQHNPNEERQGIVQETFEIPNHALPRGHLTLRAEGFTSRIWTVSIDEIVVRGKLDQNKIRRSLL